MQYCTNIYQYFFPPEPEVDYKKIPDNIKNYIDNYAKRSLTNEEKQTAVNEYIKRVDIKFFEAIKDIKEDNELNKKLYKDAKAEARQRSIAYDKAKNNVAVAVPSSARSRNDSLVSSRSASYYRLSARSNDSASVNVSYASSDHSQFELKVPSSIQFKNPSSIVKNAFHHSHEGLSQ